MAKHKKVGLSTFDPATQSEKLFKLGMALRDLERYEQALDAFKEAVQIGGNKASLQSAIAVTLCDLGKYKQAEGVFHQAVELSPNNAATRYRLAAVLSQLPQISRGNKGLPRCYCNRTGRRKGTYYIGRGFLLHGQSGRGKASPPESHCTRPV